MAVNYAGTISVTNGSAVVTGTGTEWTTLTVASDYILVTADGTICKVSALASSTELTLTKNYAGATATNVEYEIFPTIGADVELGLLVKAFIDDARDIIDGGTALLTALQAAYDTWIADRQAEFDAAQSQRATDFTAAQDARASQFATDRAQQDLDIANAMNGLEGAPIAKAIPSGAVDICEIKGASILDLNGGWTRDLSKSWAKEDRVTTTYLGVHNTTASAWTVPGAAAGDWYWDGTNRNIYILTGTAGATLSTLNRFGAAHFDARFAVAYSDRVVLLDGDGVPWMVFEISAANMLYRSGSLAKVSVAFVGGELIVGANRTGVDGFVQRVNFVSDNHKGHGTSGYWRYLGSISERNAGLGTSAYTAEEAIVNTKVNAVAAMVLPNAPADPVTGLPIARIYVGHDAGIEAILEDGSIVTSSYSLAVGSIAVSDHGVWWNRNTSTYVLGFATHKDVESGSGWGDTVAQTVAGSGDFDLLVRGNQMTAFGDLLALSGTSPVSDAVAGLMIHWPNYSDLSKGLSSVFNSDFVTPPMFGDVKTALFCERGAASLVGVSELDEDFSGYADNAALHAAWARRNPTDTLLTLSSGAVRIENNAATPEWASRQFNTVVGQTYFVTGQRVGAGAGVAPRILVGPGNYNGSLLQLQFNADGILSGCFTATGATTYLTLATNNGNAGAFAIFDNVSVKLATPDRSVNNKGAVIHGTLSRDADGWVSGFSASNYIEQPYSSDLDFGTGDFYVGGEINTDLAICPIVVKQNGSDYSIILGCYSTGQLWFATRDGGSSTLLIAPSASATNGQDTKVMGVRRNGILELWVNGHLIGTSSGTVRNVSGGSDTLNIGYDPSGNAGVASHGSRIRSGIIGAGAPSTAQIRTMSNWKGDVIEGTIHDTDYVESMQGLWVLTSSYLYEIGPDGAERSKQVNDIGATTLTAFHGGRLVS